MSGPRPAKRTGDEGAALIWQTLLEMIRDLADKQARFPSLQFEAEEGRIAGYIGALYHLTGEPHDSVRARARMVALAKTGDDQKAIF